MVFSLAVSKAVYEGPQTCPFSCININSSHLQLNSTSSSPRLLHLNHQVSRLVMITLTNKRIRITFFLPSRKLGACENWGHRNYDIFESITRQCIRLTTFGTENSPIWTTECRSGIVVNKIRLSITVQNTNVIFLCA